MSDESPGQYRTPCLNSMIHTETNSVWVQMTMNQCTAVIHVLSVGVIVLVNMLYRPGDMVCCSLLEK
jgi:hypothetical protein